MVVFLARFVCSLSLSVVRLFLYLTLGFAALTSAVVVVMIAVAISSHLLSSRWGVVRGCGHYGGILFRALLSFQTIVFSLGILGVLIMSVFLVMLPAIRGVPPVLRSTPTIVIFSPLVANGLGFSVMMVTSPTGGVALSFLLLTSMG